MNELLKLALRAHGGLGRWREVQSLNARVSLTGALYRIKGYPEGLTNVNMLIDTRRPAVTITPTCGWMGAATSHPIRCGLKSRAGL